MSFQAHALGFPSRTDHDRRGDRLQATMRKYGSILANDDQEIPVALPPPRPAITCERVQKKITMRVKYTCHKCKTMYSHNRICTDCQHRQCRRCERYPPRRNRTKVEEEPRPQEAEEVNDRMQQTHTCHECQTQCLIDAEECPNCNHRICN